MGAGPSDAKKAWLYYALRKGVIPLVHIPNNVALVRDWLLLLCIKGSTSVNITPTGRPFEWIVQISAEPGDPQPSLGSPELSLKPS